jgi:hypothetical protein
MTMVRWWLVPLLALSVVANSSSTIGAEGSPAEQQLAAASAAQQYAYLVFYRQNDAATQAMQATVAAQVGQSEGKTVLVPVQIGDAAEAKLVARYDATRTPLPCVMGIAPNGAVSGVYPLKVEAAQLERAVLTPKYSEMVKALQEQKIVVVCMQPANGGLTPPSIQQFAKLPAFQGRTHSITVQADDASEQRFFERMKVSPDLSATSLVIFAPPGVFVGKFDARATGAQIAEKVHASGRCTCHECQKHER